jgi:hypothetical protein
MNIHQSYTVVISEIDHCIKCIMRRREQGLRLAGLRIVQQRRQLSAIIHPRKSIQLNSTKGVMLSGSLPPGCELSTMYMRPCRSSASFIWSGHIARKRHVILCRELMNNKVARVQVSNMKVYRRHAVVIGQVS